MNTSFALHARFGTPVVPLADISEEFLSLTSKTAIQRARAERLPFPTFQMRKSERSPLMVKLTDLADYIDSQYEQARKEWERVNV